ncbi:MAG: hypothetical protein L0Z62_37015 [Gemmataceae bacterium]|nr:hypothetical protein [Gemmataceae bacterium]
MFEILLGIAVCALMGKVADADGQPAFLWGGITFLLCLASLVLPIPYMRFLLAGVVAFVAMITVKMARR